MDGGLIRGTGGLVLSVFHHADDALWGKIGRYFADRVVRQELGGPLSSDDAYTWWVAEDNGTVVGFAAVEVSSKSAKLRHAFVRHNYRGRGAYQTLLTARLDWLRGQHIARVSATCTDMSRHSLDEAGFRKIGSRGKYAVVEAVLMPASAAA
jgi:GNAT superfamily N-acetyltransferase